MSDFPSLDRPITKWQKRKGRLLGWFTRRRDGLRDHLTENLVNYVVLTLFVLFVLVALAHRIFISIMPGELGVLYSRFGGGTVTDHVYGEGFHVIAPWDVVTKYNVRVQQKGIEVSVLSKEGLELTMHASMRYCPEKALLGFLHANVGPDYVEDIVEPEVIANLRAVASGFKVEELYSSVVPFERSVNESLERVARKYVVLDAVVVTSIDFPQSIRTAIEEKLAELQRVEATEYRLKREALEARRKQIEASGQRRYNEIISSSLSPNVLKWKGVEATKELATSQNAKVIVLGNNSKELPVILGGQ